MGSNKTTILDKKTAWEQIKRPWELEILTALIVLLGIVLPYLLPQTDFDVVQAFLDESTILQQRDYSILWIPGFVIMYVLYLMAASHSAAYVSMPFVSIIAPIGFAVLVYVRLFSILKGHETTWPIARGTAGEMTAWILLVLSISVYLTLRRKHHEMKKFDEMEWDIVMKPKVDRSLWRLSLRIQPLFYIAKSYRACGDGILIEGWTYVIPVPFNRMRGMASARTGDLMMAGFYAASSMESLIRIQISGFSDPIFLSPDHPNLFHKYCEQLILERKRKHREKFLKNKKKRDADPKKPAYQLRPEKTIEKPKTPIAPKQIEDDDDPFML